MISWQEERERIFRQGHDAAFYGLRLTDNPYWPDDIGHTMWQLGYEWGVCEIWVGLRTEQSKPGSERARDSARAASPNLVPSLNHMDKES